MRASCIATLLAAVCAVLPLTGCGGGEPAGGASSKTTQAGAAPLAALSPEQQRGFERASSKLINMESAVTAPVTPRALAATAACGRLDVTHPMLAALAAVCPPTIEVMKLLPLMATRCDDPAPCARLFGRLSVSFAQLARANGKYARQIAAFVPPGACLDVIRPRASEVAGELAASRTAADVQSSLERGDEGAYKTAIGEFRASLGVGADDRPPKVKGDELRSTCQLARGTDPPA